MTYNISSFLSVFAIFLATFQLTVAVDYTVINRAAATPGGRKFINDIGDAYTYQTVSSATTFIWNIFQQDSTSYKQYVTHVNVFIDENAIVRVDDKEVEVPAYASGSDLHLSAKYIQNFPGDVKTEITGILYHEMTHIWQWNGNDQARAPRGLTEGIADYVRLKAGYELSNWAKPGDGDRWDQGYSVTARFLDYCNDLRNGFVAELNKKMKDGYSNDFFFELLGKSVDQLWAEYKALRI